AAAAGWPAVQGSGLGSNLNLRTTIRWRATMSHSEPPPDPEVLFATSGAIARLTFNRPREKNALTWGMYEGLLAACDSVDRDAAVRVLVVQAQGDAFAAGTDIAQFTAFQSGEDGLAYERRLDAAVDRLERVRVPTIARVHGVAAGAGCVIALACDLRVC